MPEKEDKAGTSLAVQWLRLHASSAGGCGSIPGRGTKIPHAARRGQKIKKRNKDKAEDRGESGECGVSWKF